MGCGDSKPKAEVDEPEARAAKPEPAATSEAKPAPEPKEEGWAEPEALAALEKFCAFGPDTASFATEDCMMNPPGAPPMPLDVMLGMISALKGTTFPGWESKFLGAVKNADGTYSVLTQQLLGPMKADFPAMGPFPHVPLDSVPDVMKTEALANPVEVGTYTLVGLKVSVATYDLNSHVNAMPGKGSPSVEAVWGKKGDGSDVGFGAYFNLMGVELPKPPSKSAAAVGVYDVPPSVAWKAISDWSAPYITEANSPAAVDTVEGVGVGATRVVKMLDGSAQWNEKLTALDADGMSWSYVVTSELPAPFNVFDIQTFVCSMSVKPVAGEADKCEITIGAAYDTIEGLPDPPPLEPMYAGWAAAAAEYAKGL